MSYDERKNQCRVALKEEYKHLWPICPKTAWRKKQRFNENQPTYVCCIIKAVPFLLQFRFFWNENVHSFCEKWYQGFTKIKIVKVTTKRLLNTRKIKWQKFHHDLKDFSKHVAKTLAGTNTLLKQTPSARKSFQWKSDTAREHYTRSKSVIKTNCKYGVG